MTLLLKSIFSIVGVGVGTSALIIVDQPVEPVEIISYDYQQLKPSIDLKQVEDMVVMRGKVLKNTEDEVCLTNNIYFEARNQPTEGQVAVAWATINRIGKFGNDSICDAVLNTQYNDEGKVIKNKCHFSWICDGKSKKEVRDDAAYMEAKVTARMVIDGMYKDPTNGADHYVTIKKEPDTYWVSDMKPQTRLVIGDHVFYQWKKPVVTIALQSEAL